MRALIDRIGNSFSLPLPGREAQYRLAHAFRGKYPENRSDARKAGVLLLLYPKNEQWHLIFIQRPSKNPHDHHAGQISFPGGKFEESDPDMEFTALREAQEEVGADPSQITILGKLTDLYIPVSNFLVAPFVGVSEERPQWVLQEEEVAGIIEFPLLNFRDPAFKGVTSIKVGQNLRLQEVPFFNVNDKVLWGATAMILNEFLEMSW